MKCRNRCTYSAFSPRTVIYHIGMESRDWAPVTLVGQHGRDILEGFLPDTRHARGEHKSHNMKTLFLCVLYSAYV